MWGSIEFPVWFVVIAGLLAFAGLMDRILGPWLRWVLRRRANRLLGELNQRLSLRIQPFKLTRRHDLIDRLTYDPRVMEAVEAEAEATGVPREVLMERVRSYAKDIAPSFSATAYFAIAMRLCRWVSQALYRVRLGYADNAELSKIDPDASVVFVINHRSNLDYVLVTYLVSQQSAMSYAVGEWASVWPLRGLIRAMGAFFIRRKSGDELYRRVLARYVQMATEGGVTQAVFPEGGLSRDGKLGAAKLGLISYIASEFDTNGPRDVVFVPVALNYDRVLEDRVLINAETDAKGRPRFRISIWKGIRFFANHVWLRIRRKYYRYGYACVSFGHPLSLRSYLKTHEITPGIGIEALGGELMRRIGEVTPVLPVSLAASVLLRRDGMTESELRAATLARIEELESAGAHCHIPRGDRDYAVEVGIRALLSRNILLKEASILRINPKDVPLLHYYANTIWHLGQS